jgi:hypothetical protein
MNQQVLEALIMAVVIGVLVVGVQLGQRRYHPSRLLLPIGLCGFFGWKYLHNFAATTPNVITATVGAAIGLTLGLLILRSVTVRRGADGHVYTTVGATYVAIWLTVLIGRLVFVLAVNYIPSFRQDVGEFLVANQIQQTAVSAFFVLMALTMVMVRTVSVVGRARTVTRAPRPALAAA